MLDRLPSEVLEEILVRLPHKVVFQMRCVSKRYSSVTRQPCFIDRLLLQQPKPQKLIYLSQPKLFSLDYEAPLLNPVEIHHSTDVIGNPNFITIWGHCNGFLCVSSAANQTKTVFLWNPYTRESKKVPDAPKRAHSYMLGYDAATRDYIVLSLCTGETHSTLEVYSSRRNSWRRMPDIPYGSREPRVIKKGYFINDAFYWVEKRETTSQDVILKYQVETGMVDEVPLPDNVDKSYTYLTVRSIDGNLCAFVNYRLGEDGKALLLRQCDAVQLWTELMPHYSYKFIPLSFMKNGNGLLIHNFWGMYFYDFKSGSHTELEIQNGPNSPAKEIICMSRKEVFEATVYVESIAPLCSRGDNS